MRHCLASRLSVQTDFQFGNLPPPQIPGTCDIQTRCCCSGLNLGDKSTYFTDQVIPPKKYHVRTSVSSLLYLAACIITATLLSVKLYLTLRRHINQIHVPQVAQNDQGESVKRKRRSSMASLYVYLVFIVCYLPNICVLIIIANISEPKIDLQHLHSYTLTLLFVNSTLNPLIYCWKMKGMQHTIVGTLRNPFSSPT